MRFRPPVWGGVLFGLMGAGQVLFAVTGPARVLHAVLACGLVANPVIWLVAGHVTFDEQGFSMPGRFRRVRYRWDEVTFLGVRRRHDRWLTVVLADGRRKQLTNVPAAAYPRVRELMLAQEPTSVRSDR